ncbi:hypothetical protein SRHO_G00128240 [Serrasalmus rhombeus]
MNSKAAIVTADLEQVLRLVDSETTVFSQLVEGLEPYTEYQFRLLVSHGHGESSSSWIALYTAQDLALCNTAQSYSDVRQMTRVSDRGESCLWSDAAPYR